jgi:L-threonylcarbamoyladenylate synthase
MALSVPIQRAGRILRGGGVVAYPTEGVFGLGCIPDYADAVIRILSIKKRSPSLGLVLIASCIEQLDGWAKLPPAASLDSSLEHPVTWIVPADVNVPSTRRIRCWFQQAPISPAIRRRELLTSFAAASAL